MPPAAQEKVKAQESRRNGIMTMDEPHAGVSPATEVASLSYDRLCDQIVAQTDTLRSHVKGTDMTAAVPTCPGWNLGQLLRHLGGAHRSAETIVRTRATQAPTDEHWRDVSGYTAEDPTVLDAWLAQGAAQLADTLRAAGPATTVWIPVPTGAQTTVFHARRMAHETLIHRADAALAVGAHFTVDEDVAIDALDEWMELGSLPMHFEIHPWMRELLGPGRTLHFHATDTVPETAAEWLIDLTGEAIVWRRAHAKAAVAVRAPLTDLLLVIYRRRPAHGEGIDILGDEQLLDFWLERVTFG
jgi:uncharacterized protein (TIGR03083 family)